MMILPRLLAAMSLAANEPRTVNREMDAEETKADVASGRAVTLAATPANRMLLANEPAVTVPMPPTARTWELLTAPPTLREPRSVPCPLVRVRVALLILPLILAVRIEAAEMDPESLPN